MPLRSLTERLRGRRGFSLVELMLSTVIVTLATLILFNSAATTTRASADTSERELSVEAIQSLRDTLQNYVAADASLATAADFAPAGSWRLPNDNASCAHALAVNCTHEASAFLPAAIRAKRPNARLSYRAEAADSDGALRVTFALDLP